MPKPASDGFPPRELTRRLRYLAHLQACHAATVERLEKRVDDEVARLRRELAHVLEPRRRFPLSFAFSAAFSYSGRLFSHYRLVDLPPPPGIAWPIVDTIEVFDPRLHHIS